MANNQPLLLTGTLSADGNSTSVFHPGGDLFYQVSGTWGSGTTTLEIAYTNGGTFYPAGEDSQMTANNILKAELPPCYVRLALSGATSPSLTYNFSIRVPV
jgi:hypothetical protein